MIFNIGMLTISNIAVRFLGMFYKVWLSQAISPVALGIFQLSMSVYMVLITPVASGLPNAVSRLSAKYMKQGHAGAVLLSGLKIGAAVTVFSGAVMLAGCGFLASAFLHEKTAWCVILALIPAVTLGALASLPAAYLHAHEKSSYPAVFEIIEQISKILFGIAVISLFASGNTSQDAALAALAVSFGGVLSFIMLFACCGKIKKTGPDYTRELLQNALPPTLSRFATTLLHLGTTTILPLGLMAWGLSKEAALSQYGILTSMAYPVVYMPMTVIGALCVVLLPEVAKNLGDYVRLKQKFSRAMFFALSISLLFSLLLLLFAPAAARIIFHQPLAGTFMVMLIPSVLFSGLNQVSGTMLNGLGRQKRLMINNIIDGCLGLLLTYLLVWRFGIYGFVVGNCIQDILAFLMNFSSAVHFIKKEKQS